MYTISKSAILIIIAAFYPYSSFCNTQGIYQPHVKYGPPKPHEELPQTAISAEPRLWSPFDYFYIDHLVQPAITAIGFLIGIFVFFQIADWVLTFLALTKKKIGVKKTSPLETNEIEEARRKRMISAEETQKVVAAIESAETTLAS